MCRTYSIIYWSNTKRFLSILVVFGKCFCFEKFQKIQKFYNSIFGDSLAGHASRKLTQKLLQLPSEWVPQSRKTLRKFFKISGFWSFLRLNFVTISRVEAPVVSLHRSFRDSLENGSPSREKDLVKIFKILYKGFWRLG